MKFADDELDDMHHALGRPEGPHVEPYRNYYTLDAECDQAKAMRASAGWIEGRRINAGRDAVFMVSPEGRAAVWSWLADKAAAAGLRRYLVTADGLHSKTVMARSRSAAKVARWRDVSDIGGFERFTDFLALSPSARLA